MKDPEDELLLKDPEEELLLKDSSEEFLLRSGGGCGAYRRSFKKELGMVHLQDLKDLQDHLQDLNGRSQHERSIGDPNAGGPSQEQELLIKAFKRSSSYSSWALYRHCTGTEDSLQGAPYKGLLIRDPPWTDCCQMSKVQRPPST